MGASFCFVQQDAAIRRRTTDIRSTPIGYQVDFQRLSAAFWAPCSNDRLSQRASAGTAIFDQHQPDGLVIQPAAFAT
jgi:hypothetical protein